jgi:CheY-like chemotaxis protein
MTLGKVLVVDDEPEVRCLLQDFLAGRGYEVIVAADGREALSALGSARPDVVLLDVVMPGMDGVETLRRITMADPAPQVIMLSAKADLGVTSRLLALGAVDHVTKPFDLDYLDQAVSLQLAASRGR